MSHIAVQRKTLYWPQTLGGVGVRTLAVPGNPAQGRFTFPATDAASSYVGNTLVALNAIGPELAAQRIDIPPGTVAIGIAPDSIIHSCDVAFGGMMDDVNRSGIAPGSPLIGCPPGATFALVTVRTPIPLIPKIGTFAFDSNASFTAPDPLTAGLPCAAWPLRLEFFRACVVPPQRSDRRVPMASASIFTITNGNTKRLVTCVDGRGKVDLEIAVPSVSAGTITASMFAFAPGFANANIDDGSFEVPIPVDAAGALTKVVAPNAAALLSFDGSPFPSGVLVVSLVASVGTAQVQVRVRGWD